MADQPKKKPAGAKTVNDDRRNKKAFKQGPEALRLHRKAYRGSHTRSTTLDPVQKVLLGGGQYRTWKPLIPKN